MLRTLKNNHVLPHLLGFKVTTASTPSATVNIGSPDATVARNAAGKATLTLLDPIIRAPVVVGSVGADVADGGFFTYDTDPDGAAIVGEALDASGSGDDGTFYMLALGWKGEVTDRIDPPYAVKSTSLSPRLMGFQIGSDASVVSGGRQATVAKASSIYTLSLLNSFGRDSIVVAAPVGTSQKSTRVTAATNLAASIATFDSSEAAEDNAFNAIIFGFDDPNEQGGMERAVQVPQIKPRLEVFRVNGTGTAEITVGSTDATLTDNGTGDYTITLTEPGLRACVAVPSGKATRAQLRSQPTSSAIRVLTFNGAGVATDDEFCLFVLVYDYTDDL